MVKEDWTPIFEIAYELSQVVYRDYIDDIDPKRSDTPYFFSSVCGGTGHAYIKGIGGNTDLGRQLKKWCSDGSGRCRIEFGAYGGLNVRPVIPEPRDWREQCIRPRAELAKSFANEIKSAGLSSRLWVEEVLV